VEGRTDCRASLCGLRDLYNGIAYRRLTRAQQRLALALTRQPYRRGPGPFGPRYGQGFVVSPHPPFPGRPWARCCPPGCGWHHTHWRGEQPPNEQFAPAGPAFSGPPMMVGGQGGLPSFMMLLKSANLTADQQKQVHEIIAADHSALGDKFEQQRKINEQIADKLLLTGSVSPSDLTPTVQQASQLQQQIDTPQLQTALKIRALPTTEQLNKVTQTHERQEPVRADARDYGTSGRSHISLPVDFHSLAISGEGSDPWTTILVCQSLKSFKPFSCRCSV
jgi:Spy/CpxP family protein refolding chaperone